MPVTQSPSLSVRRSLKRAFKTRCAERAHSMADVIVGLIDGWVIGSYQVPLPDNSKPETVYIPARAYELFWQACRSASHRVPMRTVLEGLITGWLDGRFQWPPKDERCD